MPVGTGTLYVVDCETEEEEANCPPSGTKKQRLNVEREGGERGDPSEGFLRMEKSGLNVTQREESLVVQYLTLGGYKHWLNLEQQQQLAAVQGPNLACSGVHSGPGQLSFGWNRRQRADLTPMFEGCASQDKPALVFVHNYHEHGVHYRGHEEFGCPKYLEKSPPPSPPPPPLFRRSRQRFWKKIGVNRQDVYRSRLKNVGKLKFDAETGAADKFKSQLAKIWSLVRPKNVIFI